MFVSVFIFTHRIDFNNHIVSIVDDYLNSVFGGGCLKKTQKIVNKKKSFSVYESVLLILSHLLILTAFFISPLVDAKTNILSTITSIVGTWGIIMISRGNYVAHYIYIVFSILYSIVSITANYYGEAIIYTFIMLPIHIFSAMSWKKNKVNSASNEVQVNKKNTKGHVVISSVICTLLSVPFYFLLVALNTENPICSTLSLSTSVLAAYFMLKRIKFFSAIFAVDDILLLVLWGVQIFQGEYQYIPTLIVCVSLLINDAYSTMCWFKRSTKRNERNLPNV